MMAAIKWPESVLTLAVGIPLLIASLMAVVVLFLGGFAVVFFRRPRNALIAG